MTSHATLVRIRRMLHRAWVGGMLVALLLLVAVRWLAYVSWAPDSGVDRILRPLMIVEQQVFLWPWAYATLNSEALLLAAVVLVATLHRRLLACLVVRRHGVWQATPLATAALLVVLLWGQFLLDANPVLGWFCAASLVLLWAGGSATGRMARIVRAALWAALLGWGLASADAADRLAIVVWGVFLATTQRWAAPYVAGPSLALVRVFAIAGVMLLSSALPLFVPLHNGVWFGDGLAYSFCEIPGRGVLYATFPVCDSVRMDYEECRHGRVVEFDLATKQRVAAHGFFSPDFYGRLELLDCLADEVQVAVQGTILFGRDILQSALAFPAADPKIFNPVVAGEGVGIAMANDARHDAVFYSAEFSDRLVRYDRKTGQVADVAPEALRRRWVQPVSLRAFTGSSFVYTRSIHPGRNQVFVAEWMQGRYVHAIDLTTLQVVARYEITGGGAMGVAVDAERDRLLVSSVWGLEVFDIATHALVVRQRLGLGVRPVLVDAGRNVIYATSTIEGKIRILDRDTFAVVGKIPIGVGSRFPHLSLDGRYLFASSTAAHYYWPADELVPGR